jgi:probable HAF family extracellular repeat protein
MLQATRSSVFKHIRTWAISALILPALFSCGGDSSDLSSFAPANSTQASTLSTNLEPNGLAPSTASNGNNKAKNRNKDEWEITDIGTLGGEKVSVVALNDGGDVIGMSELQDGASNRAFVYKNGRMTDLGTLGGNWSTGAAINRAGHIVGTSAMADGSQRAFLYKGGKMEVLALPSTNIYLSRGVSINDSGDILVEYADNRSSPPYYCAYVPGCGLLIRKNESINLGNEFYQVIDMNNAGQVVGTTTQRYQNTAIYQDGVKTLIGRLPAPVARPYSTVPFDMNNKGEVIGYSAGRPFIYSNGTISEINSGIEGNISRLVGINDSGDIIGYFSTDGRIGIFLHTNGSLIDLSSLPEVEAANWTLSEVIAINNSGQIIGHGINGEGKKRAFILTPPK